MTYTDIVYIVRTRLGADGFGTDGYATEVEHERYEVPALFLHNVGYAHSGYQSAVVSDAEAYLDPDHTILVSEGYRLEGMYLVTQPFSEEASQAWYRITSVTVGQDKLLCNAIDNVKVTLKKVSAL